MDETKNDIPKSRLRWFGHVMQMEKQRIPKKIRYTLGRNKREQEVGDFSVIVNPLWKRLKNVDEVLIQGSGLIQLRIGIIGVSL